MKSTLLHVFMVLSVISCAAPLTEDEQYEKENREILRREKFYSVVEDCKAMRGHMVIEGSGGELVTANGKIVPPGPGQKYYCELRR